MVLLWKNRVSVVNYWVFLNIKPKIINNQSNKPNKPIFFYLLRIITYKVTNLSTTQQQSVKTDKFGLVYSISVQIVVNPSDNQDYIKGGLFLDHNNEDE